MNSINCEDFAEFVKTQDHKSDSELEGNRQSLFSNEDFYKNSAEHLQEELARIEALIRHFLEKTGDEAGKDRQDFPGMFILKTEANSTLQAVCCDPLSCKAQGLKSEEIEVWEKNN